MSDSDQPLAQKASRGKTTRSAGKGQTSVEPTTTGATTATTATTATKYNVLPPLQESQETGRSNQAATSSVPSAQPFPSTSVLVSPMTLAPPTLSSSSTPAISSASNNKALKSAQLLANARAKFAAEKKKTTQSATIPPPNTGIQSFEITRLKTIKCDVCETKNVDILYKCLNCPGHHQVCSRCVEHSEPKPDGKTVGRKDWSVHAILKEAHADYSQPICLNKNQDGSYESKDVKFVFAKGKKSGVKKEGKLSNRRSSTPSDRSTAALRAMGASRNTAHGRRITAMSRAKLEKGQDQELRAKVLAARARNNLEEAGGTGEGKASRRSRAKKRKADVLDEEGNDGDESVVVDAVVDVEDADPDVDGDDNADTSMDVDEDGAEDTDAAKDGNEDGDGDGDDGWDPTETAIALEESVRDMGRK
jgi:hypothetical protein